MQMNSRGAPSVAEQAADWVLRLEAREQGVQQEVSDWIAHSPLHLKEFMLSLAIHQQIRGMGAELQARKQRQAIGDRVVTPGGRSGSKTPEQRALPLPRPAFPLPQPAIEGKARASDLLAMRRLALAVVLTCAVLIGVYKYYSPSVTLQDEVQSSRLIDGSLMLLKGDSLAHPEIQPVKRVVTLVKGEAFFDVKHDLARPFTVSAGRATVHAVGTVFAVHLQPSLIEVTVTEGRVELEKHCQPVRGGQSAPGGSASTAANAAVTLEAGEQASMSAEGCVLTRLRLDSAELDRQLSWTHPRLNLQRAPLITVVDQFNRFNRRHLSVGDATIQGVRIRGVFDSRDIESFVAALPLLGVRAVSQQAVGIKADEVVLVGMSCRWDGVRCTNH